MEGALQRWTILSMLINYSLNFLRKSESDAFVSNTKLPRGAADTYTSETVLINADLTIVEAQAAYETRVNCRLLESAH